MSETSEPKREKPNPKPFFLDNVTATKAVRKELQKLMNVQSVDSALDTPDFVLADYLLNCLTSYESAIREHRRWLES